MLDLDLMIKCLQLIVKERFKNNLLTHDSAELIGRIINVSTKNKKHYGAHYITTTADKLASFMKNIMPKIKRATQDSVMDEIKIIFKDKHTYYKLIEDIINKEYDSPQTIKQSISILKNQIEKSYREIAIKDLINKTNYVLNTNNINNDITQVAADLKQNLEMIITDDNASTRFMEVIDIGDMNKVQDVVTSLKTKTGKGRMKSGWKELNTAIRGGFKRGETVFVYALPHHYKSGFTRSLVMQLMMHNQPVLTDSKKKPLILYMSFEDETTDIVNFMYKYLYYNKEKKKPDMSNVMPYDVSNYIKTELYKNGFKLRIIRETPANFSIEKLFDYIKELEADGFEVQVCVLDYLAKILTAGASKNNNAPMGNVVRDMISNVRAFFSKKNITFITPHQLSYRAKESFDMENEPESFVKNIVGKGWTELSTSIDQVVDLEIYLAKVTINKKPHLTVKIGKHRDDARLDEKDLYFKYQFEPMIPIKENLTDENDDILNLNI